MALRENISGREYDKFVNTDDGAALRVSTVAGGSVSSNVVDVSGSATVTTSETILIQKQTLNGKKGAFFVYNAGSTAIDVNMYCAFAAGAANFSTATGSTDWDKVGSTENIAAGNTKHMPFNNEYRFVALAANTASASSSGVTAVLYAL